MLYSRPEKKRHRMQRNDKESCEFIQLGLDFITAPSYSVPPRKETEPMDQNLIEILEQKIGDIVEKYSALKDENASLSEEIAGLNEENASLNEEVQRLTSDREGIKSRVDAILSRLDGI